MTNFKKFAGLILILIIGILAGCKGGGGATKPDGKPTAKPKIKVDKSNPIQMYCIRNNTKIRDFDKTYKDWVTDLKTVRTFTNYAILDQLMKYDRLTMYEVRSNWAYIKTVDGIEGWAPQKFLKEWDIPKFFETKDNIFTLKKVIELYDHPLAGKVVDKIKKRDIIRVLKGNGERFFVVSKSGKSGWVDVDDINVKELLAKVFAFKSLETRVFDLSSEYIKRRFKNQTPYEPRLEDYLRRDVMSGNTTNVLLRGRGYMKQGDIETNINFYKDVLGYDPEETIMEYYQNNTKLDMVYLIAPNFFGMFAYIEVFFPRDYEKQIENWFKWMKKNNLFSGEGYTSGKMKWKSYVRFVEYLKAKNYKIEQTAKIRLFTRDIRMKEITNIVLKGNMAVYDTIRTSLRFRNYAYNKVWDENGDLLMQIAMVSNGYTMLTTANFSPFRMSLYDPISKESDNEILPICYEKNDPMYKGLKYVMRPNPIKIIIKKEILEKNGLVSSNLIDAWESASIHQKRIKEENLEYVFLAKYGLDSWEKGWEEFANKYLVGIKVKRIDGSDTDYRLKLRDVHYSSGVYISAMNIYVIIYNNVSEKARGILFVRPDGKIIGKREDKKIGDYVGMRDANMIFSTYSEGRQLEGVQYEY